MTNEESLGMRIRELTDKEFNEDRSRKLLQGFFTESQEARSQKEGIKHSSYYSSAAVLAQRLGEKEKIKYFEKLADWASSVEDDRKIASYMEDSMWGLK